MCLGQKAVLLDVVKRGGKNLILASEDIRKIVGDLKKTGFPKEIKVTISNDLSNIPLNQVNELVNSLIFGVLRVVALLMFFFVFVKVIELSWVVFFFFFYLC